MEKEIFVVNDNLEHQRIQIAKNVKLLIEK